MEHLFSVTIKDCEVQTFRSGGPGGQNQNKVSSGVRVIHHPSGARGECRETRDQLENKRRAFKKMAESALFRGWIAVQTGKVKSDAQLEREVLSDLSDKSHLKIEVRQNGKWVLEDAQEK